MKKTALNILKALIFVVIIMASSISFAAEQNKQEAPINDLTSAIAVAQKVAKGVRFASVDKNISVTVSPATRKVVLNIRF